jgi:hypothetical protein
LIDLLKFNALAVPHFLAVTLVFAKENLMSNFCSVELNTKKILADMKLISLMFLAELQQRAT